MVKNIENYVLMGQARGDQVIDAHGLGLKNDCLA